MLRLLQFSKATNSGSKHKFSAGAQMTNKLRRAVDRDGSLCPTLRRCWCVPGYLDLQRQVGADGVEQRFGGLLPAHEHQLQIHVPFDQKAFGHQTDTRHPAERWHAVRPEEERTDAVRTGSRLGAHLLDTSFKKDQRE